MFAPFHDPTRLRSLVLLVLLLLASFVPSARAQGTTRVATLLPFVEEALTRANPEDEVLVVASVRRSLREPVAAGLVDLGNPHSPNLEQLASARPALVVGDAAIHARLEEPVARLGARLMLLDTSSVGATLEALDDVARTLGGCEGLEREVARARAELTAMTTARRERVLPLFGTPGSYYVMTERSWLGSLLVDLGFELTIGDAGDERLPGLVPVSDEAIAVARPEIVLLVAHGDPQRLRRELLERAGEGGAWASIASARLGVHVLDPALFSANPGLALPRAAQALVGLSKVDAEGSAR
ncbi:MAG: ABC transporter substrate-binding protein [Myxococcota bacterium]